MLLEIIKRELTDLLLRYRGAIYCSLDASKITKFRGEFTTKLDFQSNAIANINEIEIRSQQYREISRKQRNVSYITYLVQLMVTLKSR